MAVESVKSGCTTSGERSIPALASCWYEVIILSTGMRWSMNEIHLLVYITRCAGAHPRRHSLSGDSLMMYGREAFLLTAQTWTYRRHCPHTTKACLPLTLGGRYNQDTGGLDLY